MSTVARKNDIGIGLVGSGFMGRCHANAFTSVSSLFEVGGHPRKVVLADATEELASKRAGELGFEKSTADWASLIDDDAVDIVAITAPNTLHEPMALAAAKAGKTVYCEKPLSTTVASARRMTEAVEAAGVVNCVGFNFLQNPVIRLAKELLESGEVGEITGFRGRHAENYMADPDVPHSFRTDPAGGGALADIGSHIISLARAFLGPVQEVMGDCRTIHESRPAGIDNTEYRPVLVDDMTHALLRFHSGVSGSIEANWVASGRTMDLSFEITATKGAIHFTQERMNELHLYRSNGPVSGYTKIEAGPEHHPYGRFCPAPGHQLGFNDLKIIEVAELLNAHVVGTDCHPNFREALEIQKTVEAIALSHKARNWTVVEDMNGEFNTRKDIDFNKS